MKPSLCIAFMMMATTIGGFLGCSCGSHLDSSQFLGVWVATEGSPPQQGKIELFPDGRFSATNIPLLIVIGPHATQPTGGGSGSWSFVKGHNGPDIQLVFAQLPDRTSGFAVPIHISGRKPEDIRLFFWKGEAGEDRFEFIRQQPPSLCW